MNDKKIMEIVDKCCNDIDDAKDTIENLTPKKIIELKAKLEWMSVRCDKWMLIVIPFISAAIAILSICTSDPVKGANVSWEIIAVLFILTIVALVSFWAQSKKGKIATTLCYLETFSSKKLETYEEIRERHKKEKEKLLELWKTKVNEANKQVKRKGIFFMFWPKKISKEEIIDEIVAKIFVFDINRSDAEAAVEDVSFVKCIRHSTYHYLCIYKILESKLKTIKEKEKKEAYLNCLLLNYTGLQDTGLIDVVLDILIGGILGVSLIDIANLCEKKFLLITWFLVLGVKLYTMTNKRYKIYCSVIEHLKDDLKD